MHSKRKQNIAAVRCKPAVTRTAGHSVHRAIWSQTIQFIHPSLNFAPSGTGKSGIPLKLGALVVQLAPTGLEGELQSGHGQVSVGKLAMKMVCAVKKIRRSRRE